MPARPLSPKDIVSAVFPDHSPGGHEQQGRRPAVVVGTPDALGPVRFSMVVLVPLTRDRGQDWALANPDLYPRLPAGAGNLPEDSVCLLDQVRAVDAGRLKGHRGRLTEAQYRPLLNGLARLFGTATSGIAAPSGLPPGGPGAGGAP